MLRPSNGAPAFTHCTPRCLRAWHDCYAAPSRTSLDRPTAAPEETSLLNERLTTSDQRRATWALIVPHALSHLGIRTLSSSIRCALHCTALPCVPSTACSADSSSDFSSISSDVSVNRMLLPSRGGVETRRSSRGPRSKPLVSSVPAHGLRALLRRFKGAEWAPAAE